MNHLYEKTIKSNSIYSGKIIDLQVDEVELPNGKTSKREIIKHPGAVAILPITTEGKLILVRQFRKALEKTIIEIPAGKLDAGEEPADCAKRELAEETGYVTDNLDFLLSFYTSPGFADELIYMYVATGLTAGEVNRDEDEFLDVIEVTLEEAEEMVQDERIHDAKTAYAIQYMRLMKYLGN
ncbi:NUDIX hydrolase [Alkalihalophilus pseudofirmus]|uniref:NUDIX hydrolase n=1 Tax=Alkalihalophilus pseudofirmus TaxID=79885 RepID=A0AAJ2L024_ALKPS|nr:NUDIX hydrolase [Alkalihalophilus pseudofirmus]MDV2884189.1 NUDIX hydrolase [Alkalihalophilus pseudofirmus]